MRVLTFIFILISANSLEASNLPWQAIDRSNAYWASVLDVEHHAPRFKSATEIVNSNVTPDPSFQLINAAVKYQIRNLPNNDMVRFADSMMHVLFYLSGGFPAKPNSFDRAGWWHLSYPVAVRYGLEVNAQVDERYDFELSTKAAMRYAKDLQSQFKGQQHKWLHAFIEDPLTVKRNQPGSSTDSLMKNLFAIYKVMVISDYTTAEDYAVQHFYGSIDQWNCKQPVITELVMAQTGIQKEVFNALNPELVGKIVPAKKRIRLTNLALANMKRNEEDIFLLSNTRLQDDAKSLASARKSIIANRPDPRKSTTTTYKVKGGDNLGAIAERFGVRVSDIKSWNNLSNDMIYAGQKLVVYGKKRSAQSVSTSKSTKPKPKKTTPAKPVDKGDFISYKVKNGDTLWSIARRFPGVSPDNIMSWNGINTSIKVGQNLKILKSEIRDYSPTQYPDNL